MHFQTILKGWGGGLIEHLPNFPYNGDIKRYIDVYGNTAGKNQVKLSELNSDFSN